MNKKNILTFIIVFLALNFIMSFFTNGNKSPEPAVSGDFTLFMSKNEYGLHEQVQAKIKNNTTQTASIATECPAEPLGVYEYRNNEWLKKTITAEIKCSDVKNIIVEPGKEISIDYKSWNHALFGDLGKYKIMAQLTAADGKVTSIETGEFEIKPESYFGIFWTTVLYQPIYNILVFLISIIPFQDLGFAIILLTILIRTILLLPSHKALKSQRKLQDLQPKLAKLKEKYKDNQEMLAKETMALWKENKVNPFGSCLPLLIQFPVLIALFYVIQNGLSPDNAYLLYGPLKDFSITKINVIFLGILDLTAINAFILPLLVGALQFLQMKLAVMKSAKNKKTDGESKKNETEMANQMMVYVMPVMIAVFTASVPAGVGLYWSVSTLYGIIQQLVVNKQVSGEQATVKVIK